MKKIIFISFSIITSCVFLFSFKNASACTMPVAEYTAGRACTSQADVSYFQGLSMTVYQAGGDTTQSEYLVTQCSVQAGEYQTAMGKYNDCVGNLSAPCPGPNQTRRTDTSNNGSSCYCNDGYTNNYKGGCIDNNTNCQDVYGSNSYWGTSGCQCSTGYQFNSIKTACVQITCYANSSLVNNQCVCNDGYINRDGNSCISYTDDCIRQNGAHSIGAKGQNNNSICSCEDGFTWNDIQKACVKNVITPVISPQPVNLPPVKKVAPEETVQPASHLTQDQINSLLEGKNSTTVNGDTPVGQMTKEQIQEYLNTINPPAQAPQQPKTSNNIFSSIWNFIKNIFK